MPQTLEKLDQKAEEREVKWMQLEPELEEKRREKEREHEMHMKGMMLSFMQQMVFTMARGQSSSALPSMPSSSYSTGMPPVPPTPPYPLYPTEDYNSDN